MNIFTILFAGELGKAAGLSFCQCFLHTGHLCDQHMVGHLHPEEGENEPPPFDRLRLLCQRCLQLPNILHPVTLEHAWLSFPLPGQPLPPRHDHFLEQAGAFYFLDALASLRPRPTQ